jgi:hypothetical protein
MLFFSLWPGASPYLRKKWGEGDDELLRLSPSGFSLLAALFLCVSFFFPTFFFPSVLASSGFFFIKFSWKIMRFLFSCCHGVTSGFVDQPELWCLRFFGNYCHLFNWINLPV